MAWRSYHILATSSPPSSFSTVKNNLMLHSNGTAWLYCKSMFLNLNKRHRNLPHSASNKTQCRYNPTSKLKYHNASIHGSDYTRIWSLRTLNAYTEHIHIWLCECAVLEVKRAMWKCMLLRLKRWVHQCRPTSLDLPLHLWAAVRQSSVMPGNAHELSSFIRILPP